MKIGSELEFFIFKDSYEEIDQKGFVGLTPFSRYMEDYNILQGTKEEDIVGTIRRNIHNSGIPVEFSKGETGLGQQEINLQYTGALEMADRHVLYKHAAKEIAWQKGHAVSFMAKYEHPPKYYKWDTFFLSTLEKTDDDVSGIQNYSRENYGECAIFCGYWQSEVGYFGVIKS